ncbi:putattive exported protein [Bordetella ansorpii]|uniref:Putattive exported protein n=1 Tax=Bordetella ansorpii TaxID=288768 RepID=A0A157P377_9BORD|nr:tripartite tricarboxylate transporter substrate binding protein [Bordetella ansorpii]SAI28017.1 putattive exported protein [Bordetella ansorpii]
MRHTWPPTRAARHTCRHIWTACKWALLLVLSLPAAHAQRHYEMVIPIAAGGSMDLMARSVSEALARNLGTSVTPMNKVGAGTLVGTRHVGQDRSEDGRLMLFTGMPYTTLHFKEGGPAFDESRFKPVMYVGWQPTVLFIRSSIPANDLASFIRWARATPNGVTFASSGIGSSPHIAAEQFSAMTGIKIVHVPMAGSSAFVPALAGGHVDAVFDAPATRSMVKDGYLKALVVGNDAPLPDWPELPTAPQAGLTGFRSGTWYGVLVPSSTPDATVSELNARLNAALSSPLVKRRADEFGITLAGGSAADFAALLQKQQADIGKLIQSRGIVIP